MSLQPNTVTKDKQRVSDAIALSDWERATTFMIRLREAGIANDTVNLWRVEDGALQATLNGKIDGVRSVAFSPDGQVLASSGSASVVRLWRVHDGALLQTLKGHVGWVLSIAFSPDGQTLATAGTDNHVTLWMP